MAQQLVADLGVKGSQAQILSARPRTLGDQRKRASELVLRGPFRIQVTASSRSLLTLPIGP